MLRFMQTQITQRIFWVEVATLACETYTIPAIDYCPEDGHAVVRTFEGYGVRESAPGYLDYTDWEVFDTLAEAEVRAKEIDAENEEQEEES